jgi:hypothetical protein
MMLWKPLLAITTILTLLAGSAWYGYGKGSQAVQSKWDAEKLATAQILAEEQMKARQREQALQAIVDQQKRKHRAEVNRVVAEYTALVDGLRNRPEARASGGVPESPSAGTGFAIGCTGAQLSGPDSRFLAGEAARADQLRIALGVCLAHTAEIERQLNGAPSVK